MSTNSIQVFRALGEAYISGEKEDDYWLEGDPVHVEVNHQEGQVRIGLLTEMGMSEDAGLYLSPSEARNVMVGLGAAIAEAEARA